MASAVVTNVIPEGNNIRVFWTVAGRDISQVFRNDVTKAEVRAVIKATVEEVNKAESFASSLQSFVGTVIE